MPARIMAEYIWLDGTQPTARIRSKTKILEAPVARLEEIPEWGFDGSSTRQATGHDSDLLLRPVHFVPDPLRGEPQVLVICEVFYPDDRVHESNARAHLRAVATQYAHHESWFGIEQEYTMYNAAQPLGWPPDGYPAPQGNYYCAVGADVIAGRKLVEAHMAACLKAGIKLAGINAEVMLGQWEFQIGPLAPLMMADELWLARWLLLRLGEDININVSFAPKPVTGDWNGAGGHANFSTKAMRAPGGIKVIEDACAKLRLTHGDHIAVYGAGNDERLTGLHETCAIHEFRYGIRDRGASVRIPMVTAAQGCGYLEDRRPAANADPYQVCARLMETVCGEMVLTPNQEAAATGSFLGPVLGK